MKPPRIFFYVQHLWGVGHVYRATRIAHGLARAGAEVHLIWGGTEVPGFDFSGLQVHRLPPVRSGDASFSELFHADGRLFSEADKEARRDELLNLFDRIKPDIVITEAFPFGRRQMQFELIPLLDAAVAASPRPLIAASIRDIMQEDRKPSRIDESNSFVDAYFDLVMVHGDEQIIPIEKTLQGVEKFHEKIRYTGLVTPEPRTCDVGLEYKCDILVSVGGGAFGQELVETAVEASKSGRTSSLDWLIAAGSQMPDDKFRALQAGTGSHTRIVRFIPDLMSAMQAARVSVSHAGYNTVADILRAGTSAVLYPYIGGRETEQLRRSRLLQELGLAVMIEPDTLTAENLVAAIKSALDRKVPQISFRLDGADQSARILLEEYASLRG